MMPKEPLFVIDRWFPSAKTCSSCGVVKETLSLKERVFSCECGLILDRDLNASIKCDSFSLNREIGGRLALVSNLTKG
ncbi:zinc ribbon domain-containing protein [Gloeothece citriformis]|uniref:zinc ribbon domain-containing protein n=1 Tax=Gloeothece citriformis TaxID=2546356 RepID=UPI0026B34534